MVEAGYFKDLLAESLAILIFGGVLWGGYLIYRILNRRKK